MNCSLQRCLGQRSRVDGGNLGIEEFGDLVDRCRECSESTTALQKSVAEETAKILRLKYVEYFWDAVRRR